MAKMTKRQRIDKAFETAIYLEIAWKDDPNEEPLERMFLVLDGFDYEELDDHPRDSEVFFYCGAGTTEESLRRVFSKENSPFEWYVV